MYTSRISCSSRASRLTFSFLFSLRVPSFLLSLGTLDRVSVEQLSASSLSLCLSLLLLPLGSSSCQVDNSILAASSLATLKHPGIRNPRPSKITRPRDTDFFRFWRSLERPRTGMLAPRRKIPLLAEVAGTFKNCQDPQPLN
jgi:hypothetical protein